MDLSLEGKIAIVCGSTQGIGKACAFELAAAGAKTVLVSRNEDKLSQIVQDLNSKFDGGHQYLVADFSKPSSLKETISEFVNKNNLIHILVNNTGGPSPGPAINANESEFISAFENHLLCNHILAQALVPLMKKEQYGRIINIISTSVKVPIDGLGVSNTIRGAVANWAKTLANELGQFGITVNNVLPGATRTARLGQIIEGRASKAGRPVEEIENEWKSQIPAKRFASPEEVAAGVVFLASPAASYINGINLPVDGGRTPSL